MEKISKLFEPGKIGQLEIKNRIIMSPVGSRYSSPEGFTTEHEIALWAARAKGGVGLIHKTVWAFPPSFGHVFFSGHMDISDDAHAESAKRFTSALKAQGARVSCFVSHPGKALALFRPGVPVIAPSAVRDPITGVVPRELSKDEIEEYIEGYAEGTRRGKMVGFEAVMLQGGHGYLIHQFLSPRTNRRTDEYGGSVANRARFACRIIKRIKEKVGRDFPVLFRMNGNDFLEGGITLNAALQQAPLFVEAGADALDVSAGPREAHQWQFITHIQPFGALVHLANAIKKVVKVPVCTVGKMDPVTAERAVREGSADFVDFCRSLLTDPDWPNKAKEGRLEDIRPCIYCNKCLESMVSKIPCGTKEEGRFCCSVNPALGWEAEYEREMRPASTKKKVMVIGGGLAGMEAARTLAERGHDTSLYEKNSRLGGQWNIVSSYHPELGDLVRYLSLGLDKAKVKTFLGKEVTPHLVQQAKPDAVVVTTGGQPAKLEVSGCEGKNVLRAIDVLTGNVDAGKEVVVIGGRGAGLDAAIFLAEHGKKVSVVELRKIAWGFNDSLKLAYWEKLVKNGINTYPDTIVDSITENGVNIFHDGEIVFLKADTVVVAIGYQSENSLIEQLKGSGVKVYSAGDCVQPRDVLAAINEASAVARAI